MNGTDLWLQFGRPELVVLVFFATAARTAPGYPALGRVQGIVGVQHADDAARGAPGARGTAVGRRIVEPAVGSGFQLVQVVQGEHGRKGHRVLGMVADHHGRGPELPCAGHVAALGTAVQHDHAADHVTDTDTAVAAICAERPVQGGMMVVVRPDHREILVMIPVIVVGRLVALVEAVALPARAHTVPGVRPLPAHRSGPRLAPFPFHLGPADLQQPVDYLELRPVPVTGPDFFAVRIDQLLVIVATCTEDTPYS